MFYTSQSAMTHSHVRVRTDGKVKPGLWPTVLVVVALAALAFALVIKPMWMPVLDESHRTAQGQILETRIAVYGNRESGRGGFILYRIEAHVRYALRGQQQDRWVVASEITADRVDLAMRFVKKRQSCTVYWASQHPDNAKCRLP
jgi:hypothetical protein